MAPLLGLPDSKPTVALRCRKREPSTSSAFGQQQSLPLRLTRGAKLPLKSRCDVRIGRKDCFVDTGGVDLMMFRPRIQIGFQ